MNDQSPTPPPLNLRSLLLTSGLSATYPDAGSGRRTALVYLAAQLHAAAERTSHELRQVQDDSSLQRLSERRKEISYGMQGIIWVWLRVCYELGLDPYVLITEVFKDMSLAAAAAASEQADFPLPQRVHGATSKPLDQVHTREEINAGLRAGIDYGFADAAGLVIRRVSVDEERGRMEALQAYDQQDHPRLEPNLCGEEEMFVTNPEGPDERTEG